VSESMDAGEEEDGVEERRTRSRARTATAARIALRKVHMASGLALMTGRPLTALFVEAAKGIGVEIHRIGRPEDLRRAR
jgi:hypothetical protein